ncbi:PKD domain-containing protein [Ferruginibacter sp.]|nr:hypothetical protein [Ferruginibacter sp.]
MKKLLLPFVFISAVLNVQAQKCPGAIVINASQSEVKQGQTVQFTVEVTKLSAGQALTYNWMVSSGEISSGQGTASIIVAPSGGIGSCTVTVELGGLAAGCSNTKSETIDVIKAPEKILSVNYTNTAALNLQVKKFVSQTKLNDLSISQTAVINIYTSAAVNKAKLTAAINKAFEASKVYNYQYKIVATGVKKTAAVEMFIIKD